jgi:hypothetical protein
MQPSKLALIPSRAELKGVYFRAMEHRMHPGPYMFSRRSGSVLILATGVATVTDGDTKGGMAVITTIDS